MSEWNDMGAAQRDFQAGSKDDKVARFIDSRDEQVLEECTKAQLQAIADHFGIKLKSARVGERRLEIIAQLKARDEALGEERPQTPASEGERLSIGGSSRGSSGSRHSIKLEIMKLQLEAQQRREEREAQLRREEAQQRKEEREAEAQLRREEAQLRKEEQEREAQSKREEREAQSKREEREAQLRREEQEREAQLRREEREQEVRLRQQEIEANKEVELKRAELGLGAPAPPQEDRRVRERDLPVFVPSEAESFFDHFERVAAMKRWPRAEWAELVQGRLTGEARQAFTMLDFQECTNYDAVKRAVLRSFKLTPECYRKRFRECTRLPGKSYAETARDMERKFLKWMDSEEAESAEEIKELMVMEKFMSVLSPEIRMRVKEADIKDLRAAADRADMLEEALRPRREGQNRPHAYVGNYTTTSTPLLKKINLEIWILKVNRKNKRGFSYKKKKEIEEAKRKHKEKRLQRYKKLNQKTKKGQPVMSSRIELMLEQLQGEVG
ncbi:trichohyalin-like [Procambarus clarkii]|uniref:trichohyalin-like n=1 Tax=Procambarus clarkii TaxID=6728 RepID=UPI0037428483